MKEDHPFLVQKLNKGRGIERTYISDPRDIESTPGWKIALGIACLLALYMIVSGR